MAQNNECRSTENSSTNREIRTIGEEFVTKYYEAVQKRPGAWPLDKLYNANSKHRQLWHGRQPEETVGMDRITPLLAKMRFEQCDFVLDSVFTRRPWPTRLTVHTVGHITHPGRDKPRKFSQTTVFVNFPPSKAPKARRFLILTTTFRFEDRVKHEDYFAAVGIPKKETTDVLKIQTSGQKPATGKQTAVEQIPPGKTTVKDKESIAKGIPSPTARPKVQDESSDRPGKKHMPRNMRKKLKKMNKKAQGTTETVQSE